MRISDWSSDVCSSDLWRGEERQIANTVFPGSIHLVINGPLYRCTRAQECPSGREGNCVGLRPERIAHKLHHATGMLQEIALYDPAEGRELGIKTQIRNVTCGKISRRKMRHECPVDDCVVFENYTLSDALLRNLTPDGALAGIADTL